MPNSTSFAKLVKPNRRNGSLVRDSLGLPFSFGSEIVPAKRKVNGSVRVPPETTPLSSALPVDAPENEALTVMLELIE